MKVKYAGIYAGIREVLNVLDAMLRREWSGGKYLKLFQLRLKTYFGSYGALAVNSGSSANLLAFYTLTSWKLGDRRIKPGDEVITVAACFPTTIAPIIQYGAVPVFIDIDETLNINPDLLESALSDKTKAVIAAHTLGNPFNIDKVKAFCEKNNLWLIEDNCDALGSEWNGRKTGTFGDLSTLSFYVPHQITTCEGGAVIINNPELFKIAESFRCWGRDCWCPGNIDNTCGKRFGWKLGKLPEGYDHKYTVSHFGFNLKMSEMQAAIGAAQIQRIKDIVKKRRSNFEYLHIHLWRILKTIQPSQNIVARQVDGTTISVDNSKPCWFGFPFFFKDRKRFVDYMESNGIQTRPLFSGNILKHPCFTEQQVNYRVVGELTMTDKVMDELVWLGVWPGMQKYEMDYMIEKIEDRYGHN